MRNNESADPAASEHGQGSMSHSGAQEARAANVRRSEGHAHPAASEARTGLEIAIVGMAGRFPGAADVEQFWENLRQGVESLTFFTEAELIARGADPRVVRAPGYVKAARMIDGMEEFDAAFFGISPAEAELIDPQQRLFLECAWEALEDAGYDPDRYAGVVGVYGGARIPSYLNNVYSNPPLVGAVGDLAVQVGNDKDYLATRVSYKLNLGGPSVTVQTACSSALVALHFASQGLHGGDCDLALAGGVGLRIPEVGYQYIEGQVYSPDGHLRAFDAKAKGTMFSNGLGILVLKRLEDALADGDRIRAVIRGSAITNDGSTKVGFTAPAVDGQARVVRAALLTAEVDAESIGYLEAHGTGTPIGDPIEVTALTQAFREHTDKTGFCALGSVKTNIGHLGAAAGAASLIKCVLALEHGEIPPSLNFEEPNPEIDFAASPFFVNTELREWKANGTPRRAGLSAFGMGGTNAHVIVEEAPPAPPSGPSREMQLLALAARTPSALDAMADRLAAHLERHPEIPLADAAYTLALGRKAFGQRRVVVAASHEEAIRTLRERSGARTVAAAAAPKPRPVVFLFSGQGSQYPGMGRGLYEAEPVFRQAVDECAEHLAPHLGADLRDVLFAPPGEESARRLEETRFTQPALFTIEYALARLWSSWGVEPEAMIGHSVGEYVAACLAGVFRLPDALVLIAARGRLMQSRPEGSMLGVPLSEDEVKPHLGGMLTVATINGPRRVVVAGPDEEIDALARRLKEAGTAATRLHTSHAFHSAMMEPILAPFTELVAGLELRAPEIPFVSNLTGTWITAEQATDPRYWARHLREAVRFADGLATLFEKPERCLLELGPGRTLATFARQHPAKGAEQPILTCLRGPKDNDDDLAVALRALGELWAHGVGVDLGRLFEGEERRIVSLPTYPFERQRYWIEPGDLANFGIPKAAKKREDIADWFHVPHWKPSAPVVAAADDDGDWLLFADSLGAAEALKARLSGKRVVTVVEGELYAKLGAAEYALPPGEKDGYDALVGDLLANGGLPSRIAHLWNVTAGPAELAGEPLAQAEARSFWSLFYLAQALGRRGVKTPVHLGVVTSNLQRLLGEGPLCPEKALVLGPAKVMPLELPNVRAGVLDVTLPGDAGALPGGWDGVAERLAAEIPRLGQVAAVVALRGEDRWERSYESLRLESAGAAGLRLEQRGVYLITGGLGGIGLTFAEFLARDYYARLILLGFNRLPPREAWNDWLATHAPNDRVSKRLVKLMALEEQGAEVCVVTADVADEVALRAAVHEGVERYGRLDGVIHAAGLAGGGVIQLKAPETAAGVLAPKVRGTAALVRVLEDIPHDFLVLCSSTIAVVGGFGQVDYCAANSFLDAYAHARAGNGKPLVVSINWGAWEQVGMAVDSGLMPGGAPAAVAEAAPPIHPLLDRTVSETAHQVVYATDLSPERHWIAAEHRILGTPTVPGTTYLEIARAAYEHHAAAFEQGGGLGGAEIQDVLFLGPLMVAEGESKEVRTVLEKDGERFRFRVTSKEASEDGDDAETSWQAHARGSVGPLAADTAAPVHDLAALTARCAGRELEVSGGLMTGDDSIVRWGDHWQCLKRVRLGDGEALAELELPERFAEEATTFGLHPAVVDVATSLVAFLEEESYLPLSYHRVMARKGLGRRLFSHLRKNPGESKETVSVDVLLLDETGAELAAIERFTLKRIGGAVEGLRRSAAGTAKKDGAKAPARPRMPEMPGTMEESGGGILPEEGVEVLRRTLGRHHRFRQLIATAKDLNALLEQIRAWTRMGFEGKAQAPVRRATHARPALPTAYAEPRNDVERTLAEIWQSSIGIDKVGIHDNFFDLGGDSVMGIQLVARANDAGLALSPEQLFEHQTIAELAALAGEVRPAEPVIAAEEPITGGLDEARLEAAGIGAGELDDILAQLERA